MANSAQARKRARQSETRRGRNAGRRSMMRTYIKRVVSAIESGNKETATSAYQQMVTVIDKTSNKGLIHQNKAARYKSRLNAQIKAL